MFEIHTCDRLGHACGLAEIELGGASSLNGAKAAGAGADITQNHDRCGASRPAFAHVRALGAFAYSVQAIGVHDLSHFFIFVAGGEFGSEPIWFTLIHLVAQCSQKLFEIQLLIALLRRQYRHSYCQLRRTTTRRCGECH